jgi:predicted transcriptional regulator
MSLLFIIALSSFCALALQAMASRDSGQRTASMSALAYSPASLQGWSYAGFFAASTNSSTRAEVYSFIVDNPGVNLRGLSVKLGLPLGDVEYHVWTLMKDGVIADLRTGRYRHFFQAGRYSQEEMKVISLMRQGTTGRIMESLSHASMQHKALAAEMGVTSQGLTWQMGRLKDAGVVVASAVERLTFYALSHDAASIVSRNL